MQQPTQKEIDFWIERTEEYIPKLLKIVDSKGGNINSDDGYVRMMASGACVENNPILINALVELGLDVNKQYSNGDTPLHKAVVGGYLYSIKGLLDNGANPMIKNNQGNLPIDELEYIRPTTPNATKTQIKKMLKSAMASKRWKKLKAPVKMLSAYKRATLSANSPERLKQLGLFDNPDEFDKYFKPAAFGKKVVKRPTLSVKRVVKHPTLSVKRVVKPVIQKVVKSPVIQKVVKPVVQKVVKPVVQKVVKPILTKKCSIELSKKFNNMINTPYTEENRKAFKLVVANLEKDIIDAKWDAGIITTQISDNERRMRRLVIFSQHLREKPCLVENGVIAVTRESNEVLNLDTQHTAPYEHFAEGINMCKKNNISRILIPIGIKNKTKKTGDSKHANLVVLDLAEKKAWRIEPNNVDKTNQNLFQNILSKFFIPFGIKFEGFYPNSCPIKHGGLCRYVVYAQYLYGDKITYENLKDIVVQFIRDEIKMLCEL